MELHSSWVLYRPIRTLSFVFIIYWNPVYDSSKTCILEILIFTATLTYFSAEPQVSGATESVLLMGIFFFFLFCFRFAWEFRGSSVIPALIAQQ